MKNLLLALSLSLAALLAPPTAQAALIQYTASLDGPSEAPPNASPGTGFAQVDIDTVLNTMHVQVSFTNLVGLVTAAHIHCCTALANTGTIAVATALPTFPGFPTGVTSGTYDQTFDLTLSPTYNAAFIASHGGSAATAEAALLAGLDDEMAYFNIHTDAFPGGEIRGFLSASAVPEPGSLALIGLGLAALGLRRGRAC